MENIKKRAKKIVDANGEMPIAHLDTLLEMSDKLDSVNESIKNKPEVQKVQLEGVSLITLKGDRGNDGETPTEQELLELIIPLIPEPIKGEDYILTQKDKKEIAKSIKVPVVEKVIEKTETIIEKPITIDKTITKEVAKYETAEKIIEKINSKKNSIALDTIDSLGNILNDIASKQTIGGGITPRFVDIYQNGVSKQQSASRINFIGATVVGDGSGADVTITGGSGSGDVVGPASSIDSNIVLFDSTTGKLIKDSGISSAGIQRKTSFTVGYSNADYIVDGVADDVQIQQAINDAAALPNGGDITVLAGIYNITSTLVIPFDAKVRLSGVGMFKTATGTISGTALLAGTALTNMFIMSGVTNPTTNAHLSHTFKIEHMTLDGANLITNAVTLSNVDYFTCDFVRIRQFTTSINTIWDSTVDPVAATIPGALFISNSIITANSGVGINLQYQTQCWISNCWFSGGAVTSWIVIKSSNKIKITNCEFNLATVCIDLQDTATFGTNDILVSNCVFALASGTRAIKESRVKATSKRVSITGCTSTTGVIYDTLINSENLVLTTTSQLSVVNGGTGATTLTGLVKGNGTAAMTVAVAGTDYQAPIGYTTENVANKATDFSVIDNTKYPTTQAVNNAINTAVTGLLDYRGSYDASTNLYPATGGSGLAGAILKGDFYICSVAGTLGGTAVTPGDLIIALVDTPAQVSANWDTIDHDVSGGGSSGIIRSINNISTNTTGGAVAGTDYVYIATAGLVFTLPTAVGNTNRYDLKATTTGVSFATTLSQTVDGSTTGTLITNQALTFISNNTNWVII